MVVKVLHYVLQHEQLISLPECLEVDSEASDSIYAAIGAYTH